MPVTTLNCKLVFKNPRAAKAFAVAARFIAETADRFPFDSDAQRAKRAARYALRNLTLKDHR